jgi:hypothetical protein
MKRRALLPTVFIILATMSIGAPPAQAGGPTSVLLVAPATASSASLYYSDPNYDRLSRMVETSGKPIADSSAGLSGQHWITVTWLLHDMTVWRVDRIVTGTPFGVVVATYHADMTGRTNATPSLESGATWHKAGDPTGLLAVLGDLKVLNVSDQASHDVPANETSRAPAVAAPHRPAVPGWKWGLGGLAAGAVLAVLGGRLSRRITRPEPAAEWASEIYLEPQDRPVG